MTRGFIREFFFSLNEETKKYEPSSRKFWATAFSSISAYAFVSKFWLKNTNITTADLTIAVTLATTAVGWYSLRQYMMARPQVPVAPVNPVATATPVQQPADPNVMYVEVPK